MDELYYIYGMGEDKRKEAKVFTETEARKIKGLVICGASFHLKAHVYGLLSCKPEDYEHWTQYASANGGRIIEWEDGKLRAPNGRVIATRD